MLTRRVATALLLCAATAAALAVFSDDWAGASARRLVGSSKAFIAACAAVLLLLDRILDRSGHAQRWLRTRQAALAALAIAAAVAWWNFMQFHYAHYIHTSDTFHYYVGSKYFDELGYTRLYACTAIADAEAGPGTGGSERVLRNLETNEIGPTTSVLADPAACKRHFSAERWLAFSHDVSWFRNRVIKSRWRAILRDHGYNPPPAWTWIGRALANTGPARDAQLFALAALDPLLIAVMWSAVAWAFGWRALCVAVIFWGTNLFGVFGWTGGSFLRQSWLVATVAGICLLRRGFPASAGACLATAALFRIFPGACIAAVALRAAIVMARARRARPEPRDLRFAAGAAAATLVLGGASLVAVGGVASWADFAENSRVQLATPLKNHVGFRTALAHDPSQADRLIHGGTSLERYDRWRAARRARAADRVLIYGIGVAGFIVLLAFAVRDQPDWVAAILGVGLVPIAFELTSYYYAILLAYGLLVVRWPSVGPVLLAVSAGSWAVAGTLQWTDEIMAAMSVVVGMLVLYCTLLPLVAPASARGEP